MKCIWEAQPALISTRVNTINNWEYFWQVQKNPHHKSLELPCRVTSCSASLPNMYKDKKKQSCTEKFIGPSLLCT